MDLNLDLDSTSLFERADKSKVPPILQKRIIAFVNHFILKTCTFLNEFVEECEIRFIETERKMQKLEATLIILEEKLASIPQLEPEQKPEQNVENNEQIPKNEDNETTITNSTELTETVTTNNETVTGIKANEDARYKKYFKMLQFGVPPPAVKIKMKSEGLNPDILDTPNLILPDAIPCEPETDS